MSRALVVVLVGCLAAACNASAPPTSVLPPEYAPVVGNPASTLPGHSPLASTGVAPAADPADVVSYRSAASREGPLAADSDAAKAVVAADSRFAFRLYDEIVSGSDENAFLSPYSISTALSMILAGARDQTADELADALSIRDRDHWDDGRNTVALHLGEFPSAQYVSGDYQPTDLRTVNTVFGQQGYPFEEPFLDVLARDYGAGVQGVDFSTDPEAARLAVNGWVAEQTEQRVRNLLPAGSVDDMTRAVLVNAIYFKANWMKQFDPDETSQADFTLLDGRNVSVPTMHMDEQKMSYAEGEGWAAARLPYFGASMVVIVPDPGRFAEIESKLNASFLASVDASFDAFMLTLALPKWETDDTTELIAPLKALGVERLFDRNTADLGGITTAERLFISAAVHKANITVDEHGTEAAAATAGVAEATSLPPSATLNVDRPFIYAIRDDTTGELLFLGRLTDPR